MVQNKRDPHPIPEEEFVPLFWEDPHSLKTFLFSSSFFNHSLRVLKVDQPRLPSIRQGGASLPGDLTRLHATLLLWPEHITLLTQSGSNERGGIFQPGTGFSLLFSTTIAGFGLGLNAAQIKTEQQC